MNLNINPCMIPVHDISAYELFPLIVTYKKLIESHYSISSIASSGRPTIFSLFNNNLTLSLHFTESHN